MVLALACSGEDRNSEDPTIVFFFFSQLYPVPLPTELTPVSEPLQGFTRFYSRDAFAFGWFPQRSQLSCYSVNFVTTHPSAFCLPTFYC